MKHPSNTELYDYWNTLRGRRMAPERGDIEPGAIRKVLGDTFILEASGTMPFRIAGTRLCALFSRELKAESFLKLWHPAAQTAIRETIAVVCEEKTGIVASVAGLASDDMLAPVQLEMLILPLACATRGEARVIGAMAPMAVPYWLGAKPVGPLSLGMFRHVGASAEADELLRLRAAEGRVRRGLVVYEGGRAS